MKRIRQTIAANLLLVIACCCSFASCAKKSFYIMKKEYHNSFHVTMAGELSDGSIVAPGWYGYLYRKDAASLRWEKLRNGIKNNYAMEIAGCVVLSTGEGPRPAISFDGGKSWKDFTRRGLEQAYKGRFITSPDGYYVWTSDKMHIYELRSGYSSWKERALPSHAEPAAITLYKQYAFILDANGVLFKSIDSGKSWITVCHLDNRSRFDLSANEVAQSYVRIGDDGRGILLLYQREPDVRWVAFTTGDDGASWKEEAMSKITGSAYLSRDGRFLTARRESTVVQTWSIYASN